MVQPGEASPVWPMLLARTAETVIGARGRAAAALTQVFCDGSASALSQLPRLRPQGERRVLGMQDLPIAPGPGIPGGVVIAATDLTERFARSSGPGGQGVNTTDSKVQLSIDIAACTSLTGTQRRRILRNLERRLDGTVLTVTASTQRSQVRNRAEGRHRMAALLREALAPPPPPRRKTNPTRGAMRRRREAKMRRSELKSTRKRPRLP